MSVVFVNPDPDKNRLKHQTLLIRVIRVIRANPRFKQPHPSREQLLYHALLDGAGFVATLLQCSDLGIHVRENGGNGDLFVK